MKQQQMEMEWNRANGFGSSCYYSAPLLLSSPAAGMSMKFFCPLSQVGTSPQFVLEGSKPTSSSSSNSKRREKELCWLDAGKDKREKLSVLCAYCSHTHKPFSFFFAVTSIPFVPFYVIHSWIQPTDRPTQQSTAWNFLFICTKRKKERSEWVSVWVRKENTIDIFASITTRWFNFNLIKSHNNNTIRYDIVGRGWIITRSASLCDLAARKKKFWRRRNPLINIYDAHLKRSAQTTRSKKKKKRGKKTTRKRNVHNASFHRRVPLESLCAE